MFLEISQNSQENNCARVSFLINLQASALQLYQKTGTLLRKSWNFIKKETLAQVFSCEFCEISKKTSFTEHLRTTPSQKRMRNRVCTCEIVMKSECGKYLSVFRTIYKQVGNSKREFYLIFNSFMMEVPII